MRTLNGWQRLWIVISTLLLVPTAFLGAILWPYYDVDTVRDLGAPECREWRDLPQGVIPGEYPSFEEPCSALQRFLLLTHVNVRSVGDYEHYLSIQKWKAVAWAVVGWLACIAAISLAGWSVGWIRRGFRQPAG